MALEYVSMSLLGRGTHVMVRISLYILSAIE